MSSGRWKSFVREVVAFGGGMFEAEKSTTPLQVRRWKTAQPPAKLMGAATNRLVGLRRQPVAPARGFPSSSTRKKPLRQRQGD
jgi:hypothetical protein